MRIRPFIIWAFIIAASPGISSAGDTLVVRPDDGFRPISTALEKANDGDVALIQEGVYRECGIVVDKSIALIGVGYPVIDAKGMDDDVVIVTADNAIVAGLHIKNVETNYIKDLAAISVKGAANVVVRDNKITNAFFGIYLQRSRNGRVFGNDVRGQAEKEVSSGNALHLWHCKNMLLHDNKLKNHRDGIYLEFTDSTRIERNVSEGNLRYGLHFMFANVNDYEKNTFRDNGAGVAVMFSKHIVMNRNVFEDNWGGASYGLLLKEISDGKITNNDFNANTIGIYGESANRLEISGNDFYSNGWAMRVLGSCMDNRIVRNNFIGNTFDIATNSSRNANVYSENYWSGYTGYDLDKDGVGDAPYQPVNLFSYLAERVPESIILHRSLFIQVINFAEKVAPIFTPENLKDDRPLMKKIER